MLERESGGMVIKLENGVQRGGRVGGEAKENLQSVLKNIYWCWLTKNWSLIRLSTCCKIQIGVVTLSKYQVETSH